jgi:hypothetical protein
LKKWANDQDDAMSIGLKIRRKSSVLVTKMLLHIGSLEIAQGNLKEDALLKKNRGLVI